MGRVCSTHGAKSNAYRILVGKPEGRRSLGRSRRSLKDNNKMDLRKIRWGKHNRSLKVVVQVPALWPTLMHTR
jgi:hypothetical protein